MSNDAHERVDEERHREGNGALVHARMGVFEVRNVLWGWWRLAPRRGIMHARAEGKVTFLPGPSRSISSKAPKIGQACACRRGRRG